MQLVQSLLLGERQRLRIVGAPLPERYRRTEVHSYSTVAFQPPCEESQDVGEQVVANGKHLTRSPGTVVFVDQFPNQGAILEDPVVVDRDRYEPDITIKGGIENGSRDVVEETDLGRSEHTVLCQTSLEEDPLGHSVASNQLDI